MDQRTINYALHVLDQQLEYMLNRRTDAQEAYYHRMMLMFDIFVSNGFENNTHVQRCENGEHVIRDE